ncbi:MAG: hypothetical protein ACR2QO_13910 [Acidimicrobiales bacterium]
MALNNGSQLPSISARNLDGETVDVATMSTGDDWTVVLLYRGHW